MTSLEGRSDSQIDHLAHMPVDTIPHGCHIPIDLFGQFHLKDKPMYLELGAGSGEKAETIRKTMHGIVRVVDINDSAMQTAYSRGLFTDTLDVRNLFADRLDYLSLSYVELYAHVYMEGLLCNQRGDEWVQVLTNADLNLLPGGFLFIADIGKTDGANEAIGPLMSAEALDAYQKAWRYRYDANKEAAVKLGIQISDGEFMVAKPGRHKQRELGDAEELMKLFASADFERWAQHIEVSRMHIILEEMGFSIRHHQDEVFFSRDRLPLPGFIEVWQKGSTFKYSPLYKGMTVADAEALSGDGHIHYPDGKTLRKRFLANVAETVIHDHQTTIPLTHHET